MSRFLWFTVYSKIGYMPENSIYRLYSTVLECYSSVQIDCNNEVHGVQMSPVNAVP